MSSLLLALNGAQGTTYQVLSNGLCVGREPLAKIDGDISTIRKTFSYDPTTGIIVGAGDLMPQVSVEDASAVWVQNRWPIDPSYVKLVRDSLGADVYSCDFTKPSGADQINKWVSYRTHNLIPSIVSPEELVSRKLVLTNALYFHGTWEHPFDVTDTHLAKFTNLSGIASKVATMHCIENAEYEETAQYQVAQISLGYSRWRMMILLPKSRYSLEETLSQLSPHVLQQQHTCTPAIIDLSLPRFDMARTFDLAESLQRMGMGAALSSKDANFSSLSSKPLSIGSVVQKVGLRVDEQGVSAVAATAVEMVGTSSGLIRTDKIHPKIMKVDHPFYFAIQDKITGLILVEGIVEDPTL